MGNMRFKEGDRVRIKNIDWYNENKDKTDDIECSNNIWFYREMSKFCGKVMTISHVGVDYYTMVEDLVGYWTDEMIEGLVKEEDLNLKFKDGDRVFNTATRKWVNIIEFDLETGLYIVRYDDGLQGRSLESELTFEDDEEE